MDEISVSVEIFSLRDRHLRQFARGVGVSSIVIFVCSIFTKMDESSKVTKKRKPYR